MSEVNEMYPASAGFQPVAWAAIDDEGVQHSLWFLRDDATAEAAMVGGRVVPLYRSPTLTDAEREAIDLTIMHLEHGGRQPLAATLRGLLERTRTVRE